MGVLGTVNDLALGACGVQRPCGRDLPASKRPVPPTARLSSELLHIDRLTAASGHLVRRKWQLASWLTAAANAMFSPAIPIQGPWPERPGKRYGRLATGLPRDAHAVVVRQLAAQPHCGDEERHGDGAQRELAPPGLVQFHVIAGPP